MTRQVIWEAEATSATTRFLKDDPDGLRQVYEAVDLLATSRALRAAPSWARNTCAAYTPGRYRVIYEIFESTVTIVVMHLGRVG